MSEHVVLKNVKRDLKLATSSPIKAGMNRVTVDANHLQWLIEQAEQTESFKQLHKNYLDRYVNAVGERNELKEQLDKAETLIKKIYRISGASMEIDFKLWKEAQEYLGGEEKALRALEDEK